MPASESQFDVIVLGAGAAGLLCAAETGRRGRRVLLLEHGERVGRKILISGGGRCNFTNLHCAPANFLSANPHFAKSALARYTPQDFLALVEQYRIPWHHKTLGQLFCDGSAQAIVQMLESECRAGGVAVRLRTEVLAVEREGESLLVRTPQGALRAKAVVVATGGVSIPKMGATGIGYAIAQSFGLRVVEPRPALVPLTFGEPELAHWSAISGVSTEVVATVRPRKPSRLPVPDFREKLLFTHRGISGPAVLQVSSYRRAGDTIVLDLLPGTAVFAPLLAQTTRDGNAAYSLLREHLPQRLAEQWLHANHPADWKNASIARLEAALHAWEIVPDGDEGYSKAEVTAGGVSTADLDSATMQARAVPGLYFVGEVVDVTGHLGGHNFQWAWASAVAAARAITQG